MTLPTQSGGKSLKATSQYDYILLDGSSSMMDKWWDTLDAIQAYIDGTRTANIHSHVVVQTFDSQEIDCIQRDEPIADWQDVRKVPLGAYWGSTPLYDAINVMARRLRDLDPPRASIVIVTDGGENASKYTDLTQAKALLDWMRAKGWQITFIGANFDNSDQAGMLGANAASAIGVERRQLTNAASALAKKRAAYGLYGTPMHYSEAERQQFGGYLAAPGGDNAR